MKDAWKLPGTAEHIHIAFSPPFILFMREDYEDVKSKRPREGFAAG